LNQQPLLDELIGRYASGRETVEVVLPLGDKFVFRVHSDAAGLAKVRKRCIAIYRRIKKSGYPPEWSAFKAADDDVFLQAAYLSETCVEPEIGMAGWLRLAKEAGTLFETLWNRSQEAWMSETLKSELQEIDDAGEGSGATDTESPN
jgi:hypothetical protein